MKHGGDRKTDQDANLHLDRKEAATMLNVSPRTVASVKAIAKNRHFLAFSMELDHLYLYNQLDQKTGIE